MNDLMVYKTDPNNLDLTEPSPLSATSINLPKNDNHNNNATNVEQVARVLYQNGPRRLVMGNDSNIAPPEVPGVLRRSRRLSVLNELKLAQEKEGRAKNEFEAHLHRVHPSYSGVRRRSAFGDVTKKVTNAANTNESSSNPKLRIFSIGEGNQNLRLNFFSSYRFN